jgi:hypothetical protein
MGCPWHTRCSCSLRRNIAVNLKPYWSYPMKKLIAAALLAFAVPAFAHADEAKPADKSAKKTKKGADDKKTDDKKDAPAGDEKK